MGVGVGAVCACVSHAAKAPPTLACVDTCNGPEG
jgi:hypothetical protein